MKIVKVLETTLKTSVKDTGTSFIVQAFIDSQGNEVALADIGTYFYILVKQGSKIEIVKCNAITQNDDGSATLTVATNGRDILPKSPYTGGSTGKSFSTGAEVIFTNDPATMAEFAQLSENNAFTGANTFSQFPTKTGSTTPTNDGHFVTLAYLNSVVLGDATVSSLKSTVTFGEAVSDGDPVYFKVADGKWWRAYANNAATCINVRLAIADEDALADAEGAVVRIGRKAGFTALDLGTVYLTDAGGVDSTAGSYIVELGTAISDEVVDVEPKDGDREQFMSAITGMIVPYAGVSVPSGFLACIGQSVAYTAYPDLWNVIKSKFGLGTGQTFTVTAGSDTIDIVSHGYSNGQIFILSSTGTLPAGLAADTIYYVVNAATNTFKLSLTAGGAAIDITDAGTGTHTLHTQFKLPELGGRTLIGAGSHLVQTLSIDAATDVSLNTLVVNSTSTAADVINTNTHSLVTGDMVKFATTQNGWTAGTAYYVRVTSTSQFSIHTSRAGALANTGQVDITGTTTGGTIYRPTVFTKSGLSTDIFTGAEVVVSTAGALPTGMSAGTYYAIALTATTFKLASTFDDAEDGFGFTATAVGSGISTFKAYSQNNDFGETGGESFHKLTVDEMPSHNHRMEFDSSASSGSSITGSGDLGAYNTADDYMEKTGGDKAHNNLPPYLAINYIIKT